MISVLCIFISVVTVMFTQRLLETVLLDVYMMCFDELIFAVKIVYLLLGLIFIGRPNSKKEIF